MINKKIILAIGTVLILSGCGGGSSNTSNYQTTEEDIVLEEEQIQINTPPIDTSPVISDPSNPECLIGSSSVLGQVLDKEGNGLSDIEININGCRTVSNSEGFYQFLNIKEEEKAMVKLTSNNYATAFVPIKIEILYEDTEDYSNNYIKTILTPYSTNIDEHISLPISIPKESVKYFRYSNVNTKNERRNFPGSFRGINDNGSEILFESYGLIELDIRDSSNKKIEVLDPIQLKFNANEKITEDFITLWKFNEKELIWKYYGLAQKDKDGLFTAEVDELGLYSVNKEFEEEAGLYVGRIIYEDGSPAKDLRVYLTGENWINYTLTTNDLGEFEILVKANTQYSIYAYTYRDDYIAEYSGPYLKIIEAGGVNDDRS